MAKLRLLKEGIEIKSIDLDQVKKFPVIFGRSSEADLFVEDRAIGRQHALFLLEGQNVLVQRKSKFGKLYLNGSEIVEGVLKVGDVVSVADYLLRLEDSAQLLMSSVEPASPLGSEQEVQGGTRGTLEGSLGQVSAQVSGQVPSQASGQVSEWSKNSSSDFVQPSMESMIDEDQKTAILPTANIVARFEFRPGEANVTEFVLQKDEAIFGRGTTSDVILNDVKSSRKHLVIQRRGASIVAVDQGSANGTLVNGDRISERELADGDVLRIGDTEFHFRATSQSYAEQEPQLITVPPVEELPVSSSPAAESVGSGAAGLLPPSQPLLDIPSLGVTGTAGIPGMAPVASTKPGSLLAQLKERYAKLSPVGKVLVGLGAFLFLLLMMNPEEDSAKKGSKKGEKGEKKAAVADPVEAAFKVLPEEKKQFVVNTYQLALELYKNKEFERAVFEIEKVFTILPNGYKDAREIKSFGLKAIEIQKANDEERRRKEAEERLRAEVKELIVQAEALVAAGKDTEAREVFSRVLEKDPDNATILRLTKVLEEKEERLRSEMEAEKDRAFRRKQLETLLSEGERLLKAGRYYASISQMEEVPVLFPEETAAKKRAKSIIDRAKQTLTEKAKPHLDAGNAALAASDYAKARDAFYAALKVDERSKEAKAGLDKIRSILHDRAKAIYTEGLVAEGISEFQMAKDKFKSCFEMSMSDDVYYGRCQRKYLRYKLLGVGGPGGGGAMEGYEAKASSTDPQMPQFKPQEAASEEAPGAPELSAPEESTAGGGASEEPEADDAARSAASLKKKEKEAKTPSPDTQKEEKSE